MIKITTVILALVSVTACEMYGNYQRSSRGRALKGKCDITYAQTLNGRTFADLRIRERPVNYRLIKPNTFYTKDYRAGRVNLELDDAGIIRKVHCG